MAQSNVTKLGAAVLAEMLDSFSSDDEDKETNLRHQKKKHSKRLFNRQTAIISIFYLRYLKPADECHEPLSEMSIFSDNSQIGKLFLASLQNPLFNVHPSLP
jgi:hypothetical protein